MTTTDRHPGGAFSSIARGIENLIERGCRAILITTGLALLGILTITVAMRYSYGGSIDSGPELVALLFPVFVMAGLVEAARRGAHVATQVLLLAANETWRLRLIVLIHLVTAIAYLYLAWFAYQNAIIAHVEQSTILRVPGSLPYGSLALGLALIGVCSLTAIVRHTFGKEKVALLTPDSTPGVV